MAIYYVPSINIMGAGCLKDLTAAVKDFGFKKALVVTDKFLVQSGVVKKVEEVLEEAGVACSVFDEVIPNPTCKVVNDGLLML